MWFEFHVTFQITRQEVISAVEENISPVVIEPGQINANFSIIHGQPEEPPAISENYSVRIIRSVQPISQNLEEPTWQLGFNYI